jgi:hypothetical protein
LEPGYTPQKRNELLELSLNSLASGAWSRHGEKCIEKMTRNREPHFALTEEGTKRAEIIKNPQNAGGNVPTIENGPDGVEDNFASLGDRQIVMLVDQREGAGGRGLSELCKFFKRENILFQTHTLPVADYVFLLCEKDEPDVGQGMLLPLLIEYAVPSPFRRPPVASLCVCVCVNMNVYMYAYMYVFYMCMNI